MEIQVQHLVLGSGGACGLMLFPCLSVFTNTITQLISVDLHTYLSLSQGKGPFQKKLRKL